MTAPMHASRRTTRMEDEVAEPVSSPGVTSLLVRQQVPEPDRAGRPNLSALDLDVGAASDAGGGVIPQHRLQVLRLRRDERGEGQRQGPIRRLHDPAVDDGTKDAARDYVVAHAPRLLPGLVAMISGLRGAREGTEPKVMDFVIEKVKTVADTTLVISSTKALLSMAAGGRQLTRKQNQSAEVVALAVKVLNFAEREMVTAGALAQDQKMMKIGTEFSFGDGKESSETDASVNIKVDQPDAPANELPVDTKTRVANYAGPRNRAEERIAAWTGALTNANIPGKPVIKVTAHEGKGKFPAKKVTYTFTEPKLWIWYWVADIDEACYETQTMPTAVGEFANASIKAIVAEHIFKGAAAVSLTQAPTKPAAKKKGGQGDAVQEQPLGLRPDPTSSGGGGHLSFDLGTAFGDAQGEVSAELMLTTLLHLQQNADKLARQFRKDSKGRPLTQLNDKKTGTEPVPLDVTNAPSLANQEIKDADDLDALEAYTKVVEEIKTQIESGSAIGLAQIHAQLVAFNQRLTNPAVTDEKRKAHTEDPANISHYQAINIEHLGDTKSEDRRVEIRDIPAQSDPTKFSADLDVLVTALAEARAIVKKAQIARLTA